MDAHRAEWGRIPVTSDDKIRVFKEGARDYPKYLEHIQEIDSKLEVLRTKMEGLHSINLEKEPSPPSFKERPLVEMIPPHRHSGGYPAPRRCRLPRRPPGFLPPLPAAPGK